MRRVLNVGGSSKLIPLPPQYEGWEHVLLDVDARAKPDVVCDARDLTALPPASYDSVYCSHNLEHYHPHEVPKVLQGFRHVLKDEGFALVIVPDLQEVMRAAVERKLEPRDVLYTSPRGPITLQDVIYGYGPEIETSGNDFFSHKTAFSEAELEARLRAAGFGWVFTRSGNLEAHAIAFTRPPTPYVAALFGLPQ